MPRAIATLVVVLAGTAAVTAGAGARGGRTAAGEVKSARTHDARYCEIIALKGMPPTAKALVFNTIGRGTCPEAWWRSQSATALAHRLGATVVVLNGPRYFLMDRASAVTGAVRVFGAQRLTLVATIPIHSAADLGRAPYANRTITRVPGDVQQLVEYLPAPCA